MIRDKYISGTGKSNFIFFISSIVVIIVPGVRSDSKLIFLIPSILSNRASLGHLVILCFSSHILFQQWSLIFQGGNRVNSLYCSWRFISDCFCTAFCYSTFNYTKTSPFLRNRSQRNNLRYFFLNTEGDSTNSFKTAIPMDSKIVRVL